MSNEHKFSYVPQVDDFYKYIVECSNMEPIQCIDSEMKFCQECEYGCIAYPDWVETSSDLKECCFNTFCMYGFDNEED